VPARVIEENHHMLRLESPLGRLWALSSGKTPQQVILSIRPQHVRLMRGGGGDNHFAGTIEHSAFLGEFSEHIVAVGTQRLRVVSMPPLNWSDGPIEVEIDPADIVVLPN
ncbi:MAG: TOBE domain-containing protein, partial [Tepidisphaeraceae bacterium]